MTFKLATYRNFVEGYRKHPDQGIKACEKKLKKEPANTLYLLAQSELLFRQKRYSEALQSITSLRFTKNDQFEESLLLEIQDIVVQSQQATGTFNHTAGPHLTALWRQALDLPPPASAKHLRKAMFNAAWRDELWDLAQQLFARLSKETPANVRYHYAWIACAQMQASSVPKDDKMGQAMKTLAFRSLKAIVDNTIAAKDTPRKLSDTFQWRLLMRVYTEQEEYAELARLFNSDNIEPSHVQSGGMEMTRDFLDILQKTNSHEMVYQFVLTALHDYLKNCQNSKTTVPRVIRDPKEEDSKWADDWHCWKVMISCQEQSEKNRRNINEIPDLAKKILALNPLQRNATRARLTCLMKYQRASLLEALIESFSATAIRRACFGDMKEFMKALNHDEEEKFLNHVDADAKSSSPWDEADSSEVVDLKKAKNWVMININALKFEYLLCISKAPLPTKDSLEAFFSDSLRMYKIALGIDKECGDEACILAVMALVKLHHFSRDYVLDEKDSLDSAQNDSTTSQSYLIQAVILLEYLRHNSPFNYSGSLLLTLIAQMLNLTSLASIALGSLNIKEVQHDTIGHLFWSRISISHPFPCSTKLPHKRRLIADYATPEEGLGKALSWYELAADRTNRFMGDSLENVPFDQLFEFDEFRRKIDRSFTRAMYLLEQRRMARFTGGLQAYRELPALPPTFNRMALDSRDFATIPSFEYQTSDTFDNFVITKPKPSTYWKSRHAINDTILTLLFSQPPHEPYLLPQLDLDMAYLKANHDDMRYQLTTSEQRVSTCWDLLVPLIWRLVFGVNDKVAAASDTVKALKAVQSWLQESQRQHTTETSDQNVFPSNESLQGAYLSFEVINAVSLFCDAVTIATSGKPPYPHHTAGAKTIPADAIKITKSAAKAAFDAVHVRAEEWRKRVKEEGSKYVTAALFSGAIGEDVKELLDSDDAGNWNQEAIINDLVESAIDSLDGLCKVKLL